MMCRPVAGLFSSSAGNTQEVDVVSVKLLLFFCSIFDLGGGCKGGGGRLGMDELRLEEDSLLLDLK